MPVYRKEKEAGGFLNMVHHIVMWKFKEEIKEEQKAQLKQDMAKNLKSLVGKVPGLLTAEFVEEPIPSSTHDMALVKVADTYVRPYVTERACLDYED